MVGIVGVEMSEIITRKPANLRREMERFTEIMQGYRKIWGARPFEREAMRFMFDQLGKIELEELAFEVERFASETERPASAPEMVREIKRKFSHKRPAQQSQEDMNSPTPQDKKEMKLNFQQFGRFKSLAQEMGRDWWEGELLLALTQAKCESIFYMSKKKGPECFLNWTLIKNHMMKSEWWGRIK